MSTLRRLATAVLLAASLSGRLVAEPSDDTARMLAEALVAAKPIPASVRFDKTMGAVMAGPAGSQVKGAFAGAKLEGPFASRPLAGFTAAEAPAVVGGKPVLLRVALNSQGEVAGITIHPRPEAAPTSTDRWTEEKVTVGPADWRTPGYLTLPREGTGLAAVVILGGSGPTDADATIGANKPYRDLAHGLADRGIAVLRFDKRPLTHGQRVAAMANFTLNEEYVEDALSAVALLRTNPRIGPSRIYVLGHSLGTVALPRVAAKDPQIAGLIFAAPANPDLLGTMVRQFKYLAPRDGTVSAEEKAMADAAEAARAKVASAPAGTTGGPALIGVPLGYWVDLRDGKPIESTAKLPQPLLFLQGGRDYQVTPDEARLWKTGLDAAGKTATWKFYPALNHLMIKGEGEPGPEEYARPGHVDAAVIEDIAGFIRDSGGS